MRNILYIYERRHAKKHSLLQVGGVAKDQEPSDRHWVVSESLVSYPVKQL